MAGEKWVANNGDNNNSGSEPDPYLTIQHGVDMLKAAGGGLLHVKLGFYNENIVMHGVAYSNITVQGYAPPVPSTIENPHPVARDPCDGNPIVDGHTYTTDHRVFDIADCTNVVLQKLTIQNGSEQHYAGDDDGGGVLAQNAQVDLIECCIRQNKAGQGGGFAYRQCKTGATSTIKKCSVHENKAAKKGGGGFIDRSSNVKILNTTFLKNEVADGLGGGGLCISQSSQITVDLDCSFEENKSGTVSKPTSACNGGAVFIESCGDAPASIFIRHSTFLKNQSIGRGGAIDLLNESYAEITDNRVHHNTSKNSGGGMAVVQVTSMSTRDVTAEKAAGRFVLLENNRIADNRTETTDSGGGGIYASATSYMLLRGNVIEENRSDFNGGGMHITFNSFLEAAGHNVFRNNECKNNGGGVSSRNCHITLQDENTFDNNRAPHWGGGVYLATEDEGTAMFGMVNYLNYLRSGGFTMAKVVVEDLNHFTNNRAFFGGGMCCAATRAIVPMSVRVRHGNTFSSNATATGGSGGGFYFGFLDELTVDQANEITLNRADGVAGIGVWGMGAGGFVVNCKAPVIADNTVANNTGNDGPGLKLRHCLGFQMTGNTFTNNTVPAAGSTPAKVINVYFNACQMNGQTAATVAAANPPLAQSEILIYP